MTDKLHSLYSFTKLEVSAARSLAKQGQRDRARDRIRFIRNAQILPLLKYHQDSLRSLLPVDVPLLEWELEQAFLECHPDDAVESVDLLSSIDSKLEVIAHFVASASVKIPVRVKRSARIGTVKGRNRIKLM